MDDVTRPIAVIAGTPSGTVQELYRAVVERWRKVLRLAGVIAEDHGLADWNCGAGFLARIGTPQRFAMFEDRGRGPTACHLSGRAVLTASEAVQQDIARGCDLVILSKFGRLEAAGNGLRGAFTAAIESSIPILSSLSPAVAEEWARFAGPRFVTLRADAAAIDAWIATALGSPKLGESAGQIGAMPTAPIGSEP
jgi:hypothetical protein